MVFELGMPRPKYAFRVFSSELARAQELLAGIRESAPFGTELELSDTSESEEVSTRVPTPWNPAAAAIEVWSGDDEALATLVEACLAENQIGVRRQGNEPGTLRLLIMPADEPAAREILRQISEGIPPN
jgi:hypothetical protein